MELNRIERARHVDAEPVSIPSDCAVRNSTRSPGKYCTCRSERGPRRQKVAPRKPIRQRLRLANSSREGAQPRAIASASALGFPGVEGGFPRGFALAVSEPESREIDQTIMFEGQRPAVKRLDESRLSSIAARHFSSSSPA